MTILPTKPVPQTTILFFCVMGHHRTHVPPHRCDDQATLTGLGRPVRPTVGGGSHCKQACRLLHPTPSQVPAYSRDGVNSIRKFSAPIERPQSAGYSDTALPPGP